MELNQMFCLCLLALLGLLTSPRCIWVTLANLTGQDTLRLATASPENPFSTCLGCRWMFGQYETTVCTEKYVENPAEMWDQWTPYLPKAPFELQELELLGGVKMDFCVRFNYMGKDQSKVRDVFLSQCV